MQKKGFSFWSIFIIDYNVHHSAPVDSTYVFLGKIQLYVLILNDPQVIERWVHQNSFTPKAEKGFFSFSVSILVLFEFKSLSSRRFDIIYIEVARSGSNYTPKGKNKYF